MSETIGSLQIETINWLAQIVHENAKAKGFHPEQTESAFINYQLMNLVGEVAELHDAWRKGKFNSPCDKAVSTKTQGVICDLTCAEEEYADIIIRALDQCARLNINIGRAIAVKHHYNTTRPFRHGDKLS